jgi:TRAP-type uncharacterized transport system fused permease subunit
VTFTAMVGVAALAAGFQGWAFKRTTLIERLMFVVAGLALVYPTPMADLLGLALVAGAVAMQFMRGRAVPATDAGT